jgi:hypothetical protein
MQPSMLRRSGLSTLVTERPRAATQARAICGIIGADDNFEQLSDTLLVDPSQDAEPGHIGSGLD